MAYFFFASFLFSLHFYPLFPSLIISTIISTIKIMIILWSDNDFVCACVFFLISLSCGCAYMIIIFQCSNFIELVLWLVVQIAHTQYTHHPHHPHNAFSYQNEKVFRVVLGECFFFLVSHSYLLQNKSRP